VLAPVMSCSSTDVISRPVSTAGGELADKPAPIVQIPATIANAEATINVFILSFLSLVEPLPFKADLYSDQMTGPHCGTRGSMWLSMGDHKAKPLLYCPRNTN
jgi:hypothetical protein